MDYKIIRATAEVGQIEVLYSQDGTELGIFNIDVPIIDGAYIIGDVLHQEIISRAPVWISTRNVDVKTASGFEHIEALVQPPEYEVLSADELSRREMLLQIDFERRLGPALVKWGLLQNNPASVEVTKL